jgi:hypothetical protein
MQSTKKNQPGHNSKNQVVEGEKLDDMYGMIPRVRSNVLLVQVLEDFQLVGGFVGIGNDSAQSISVVSKFFFVD